MITGLMFALASRTPIPANDRKSEGNNFPPQTLKPQAKKREVISLIKTVSVIMAVIGVILIGYGASTWSFDPATGLNIQTAFVNFTLSMGVSS